MAKAILPTNFQDDILDSSMDGKRRYKQTTNADGTVSLEDASTYDQVGSNFGASQLNAISKAVNQSADSSKIISDPDTASATTEQGYIADVQLFNHLSDSLQTLGGFTPVIDSTTGEITGYKTTIGGADTVFPFSIYKLASGITDTVSENGTKITIGFKPDLVIATRTVTPMYGIYIYDSINNIQGCRADAHWDTGSSLISVDDTGFTLYGYRSETQSTYNYVAVELSDK